LRPTSSFALRSRARRAFHLPGTAAAPARLSVVDPFLERSNIALSLLIDSPRTRLGWSDELEHAFEQHAADGLVPARVTVQNRGLYLVAGDDGELQAELTGRLRHEAAAGGAVPAVGDWVALHPPQGEGRATIAAVLPRRTKLSRKMPDREVEEQVLAANVDVIFLVTSLNRELKLRRLERYLATAWESGASPVILLTKSDLADDADERRLEVESIAFGVPVHVVSAVTRDGLAELPPYLAGHRTAVFLGSSGVGKSTLINALAGEEIQAIGEIRESDDRGRHTTTRRELLVLPDGGIVIDTPGMRELQLWDADEGMDTAFADIAALITECRFADCAHKTEPDCAVRRALADGSLPRDRWESYQKLQRELFALEVKLDKRLRSDQRKQWRARERQRRNPKRW
jgi:ribosome biogenesis GTPase / thiamine phosphate phosphatase